MATIPDFAAAGILSFHQALTMAEIMARAALDPALHERLSGAVDLVKAGAVLQLDDGHTWTVASASTPGKEYRVNGGCSCDDAHYRTQKRCKHALAVYLSRKTLELMHAPGAHTDAASPAPGMPASPAVPPALPEAPPRERAGMRLEAQVVIDGRQVTVAVWGPDDADVQARLLTLLAQYPAPEAPAQGQPQGQGEGKDWCSKHGVAMPLTTKDGRSWYSHRTADGWCKGK